MEGERFQGTDGVRGLAVGPDHPLLRGEADARRAFLNEDFVAEPDHILLELRELSRLRPQALEA